MNCLEKGNNEKKYDNVRVSDITKGGMTLTIDDLKYLQRMLSLQDDCFEIQLETLKNDVTTSLARVIMQQNEVVLSKLAKIHSDIEEIKIEIAEIKSDVVDIYKEINLLNKRVTKLEKEIIILEKRVAKDI